MPESKPNLPPQPLDEWAAALRERFGLSAEQVPVGLILDLASDAAHGVTRPAAPLSAFVAGLVAGSRGTGGAAGDATSADTTGIKEIVAEIREMAIRWSPELTEGEA